MLELMSIPLGTFKPVFLFTASRKTLESAADPSHPGSTYTNPRFRSHTAKVLVQIYPFLDLYRGLSCIGTVRFMYVPSKAPKQPFITIYSQEMY